VLFLNYRHARSFDDEDEGTFSALIRLASLAIAKAQLQERRVRLAGHVLSRSVHENVKGRSFAVSELLARVYEGLPADASDEIRQQLELAHDWVRTMQHDAAFFGSAWFEPPSFDLRSTVEKLAHDFEMAYGPPVIVRYAGDDPARVPPSRIERVHALLFEAINNAGRHGGSLTRVDLTVDVGHDRLRLLVEDDGGGIDPTRRQGGLGTGILRELAEEAGGVVERTPRDGGGTRVRIELPFDGGGS
jgi:signal transduction histidine kinase